MNFQIQRMLGTVGHLMRRYHVTLFVIIVLGGMAVAIFILSSILQDSSDVSSEPMTQSTLSPNFDQETINRLNQLHTSSESTGNISLPSGRINPFAE